MPLDAATAARAAIVLAASRPWRLVELNLIDFPDAARTGQEGERCRPADLQELARLVFGTPRSSRLAARPPHRERAVAKRRSPIAGSPTSTRVYWTPRAKAPIGVRSPRSNPPIAHSAAASASIRLGPSRPLLPSFGRSDSASQQPLFEDQPIRLRSRRKTRRHSARLAPRAPHRHLMAGVR